ncbi:L-threonylcarbamoyladenylate synthase [Pseudogracilibacillus auburnensis]|uniref:L-threonylcarbamoyladenylate synthase n=1 Tax=Pseudogracilibacillus auburnensis TaxID=1494959 RepID=UPI001A962D5D|nr:L-threonylcarbamoyladenylate synthase [Pseudogracilibacillus auburnensis]MBO1004802.1 threonylcarbamoyl-AMP synthase [Pseudogracilibacillus auburnensis]
MNTIQWHVDKNEDKLFSYPQIQQAAHLLQENEVVAFPTETVYGLGANAQSDQAVAKIFKAKGRPADNPLIVHIAQLSQLELLVTHIPEKAVPLMNAFWPGPLTLIFHKKSGAVSEFVTAGLDTVAVRIPDHPVALALLTAANLPIAAPSANLSGKPSPTHANHVITDLNGKIAGIVDGGPTGVGVESTVVDCTGDIPTILRPGGVSKEEMEAVIGQVDVDPSTIYPHDKPKSPGMKYTHYAPTAPMYLIDGEKEWAQQLINQKRLNGLRIGVLASSETARYYKADLVLDCGSRHDMHNVAHNLYYMLRAFDEASLDMIFAETFSKEGVGAAVMNRLEKAAGHQMIRQSEGQ